MSAPPTVSVIICSYSDARWALLGRSVASVERQSVVPLEILVCIDHNRALLQRCRERWSSESDRNIPVRVVANRYGGRLGAARTSAAEVARGDILAFLDDDAMAAPDWLQWLLAPYENERTVAVGGSPRPVFERARPPWFPFEFDWVFGCAYAGLPEQQAPLAHLIGASMSVRSGALAEIGGFHSDDHDDMDMCHRLAHQRPGSLILYEPAARVHHFVPTERTTWRYFSRRCFLVNMGKVEAFRQMGGAANLSAELGFVGGALRRGIPGSLRQAIHGDVWAAVRAGAILFGILLAGAGHTTGHVRWHFRRAGDRCRSRAR